MFEILRFEIILFTGYPWFARLAFPFSNIASGKCFFTKPTSAFPEHGASPSHHSFIFFPWNQRAWATVPSDIWFFFHRLHRHHRGNATHILVHPDHRPDVGPHRRLFASAPRQHFFGFPNFLEFQWMGCRWFKGKSGNHRLAPDRCWQSWPGSWHLVRFLDELKFW